jgi:threonine synthase
MTTPDEENVRAIALAGDFDDCQAAVKAMFADVAFREEVGLAAVNSINWARVLAQTVYYFTSAVSLGAPHRRVSFTVPTGNFGDVYAGLIAKRMGLPVERLVVATNSNDILHRTLTSGAHDKEGVVATMSPSMDIQVSSNFERALFDVYDRDGGAITALMDELRQGGFGLSQGALARLRDDFDSGRADDEETRETIRRVQATTGETICPHTAVGVKVAEEQLDRATPMVTLATAHPAKFPDAVEQATGTRPELPSHLADLLERPERTRVVANDLAVVQSLVERLSRR